MPRTTLYYAQSGCFDIANHVPTPPVVQRLSYYSPSSVPPFTGAPGPNLYLTNHGMPNGKVKVGSKLYRNATEYYTTLFPQDQGITKIIYVVCSAGLGTITPLPGKIQLLPMGIVGEVSSPTPWRLAVDAHAPRTLSQILSLTAANAAEYGWRYVAAAVADDSSAESQPGSQVEIEYVVDDESLSEVGTKSVVECSGCIHDIQMDDGAESI